MRRKLAFDRVARFWRGFSPARRTIAPITREDLGRVVDIGNWNLKSKAGPPLEREGSLLYSGMWPSLNVWAEGQISCRRCKQVSHFATEPMVVLASRMDLIQARNLPPQLYREMTAERECPHCHMRTGNLMSRPERGEFLADIMGQLTRTWVMEAMDAAGLGVMPHVKDESYDEKQAVPATTINFASA